MVWGAQVDYLPSVSASPSPWIAQQHPTTFCFAISKKEFSRCSVLGQDSSRQVALRSPPVERHVSTITHFRKQIFREQQDHPTIAGDMCPYSRTRLVSHFVVRRDQGICSHAGRRVRDGHIPKAYGSGPKMDFEINEIGLNWVVWHVFSLRSWWYSATSSTLQTYVGSQKIWDVETGLHWQNCAKMGQMTPLLN